MEAKFSNNFFSVVKLLCCALPLSPGPLKYSQFWGFSKLVIFTYKFTLSVFCNLKHFGCFESCECGLMLRFLWQKKKKKKDSSGSWQSGGWGHGSPCWQWWTLRVPGSSHPMVPVSVCFCFKEDILE